jgi:hypothetical protein
MACTNSKLFAFLEQSALEAKEQNGAASYHSSPSTTPRMFKPEVEKLNQGLIDHASGELKKSLGY